MRTLRVHGDENVPPVVQGHKTLHSRNKSSPALSTMAANGAAKIGVKRAVFGDVSNTTHANRSIRDDSSLNNKTGYEINEKVIAVQQDKKPAALLRPAQRPLSVSGLRALLSNVTNTSNITTATSIKPEAQVPAPANTRKVLTKRNTTIFKDPTPQLSEQPTVDLNKPLPSQVSVAPVYRDLNPQQYRQLSDEPQAIIRRSQSKSVISTEGVTTSNPALGYTVPSEDNVIARSDGVFIDDFGNVQVCEYTDETDPVESAIATCDVPILPLEDINKAENAARLREIVKTQIDIAQPELQQNHTISAASEPEEYWDEEEGEENYDEDGYVTARSYKSRGENTTGGATTILFPQVTNKAKKELQAAKDLVEASRTNDEIEDEAWDMSMVAEYGEEIFSYMRELEVRLGMGWW